jgi:hypothetical protein
MAPPNKPYLDSSHKLIFTSDGDGAEGPTAVVSPASSVERALRAMMKSRAQGANR